MDLGLLEMQARTLYLHRFVKAVQEARREFGRFLTLRAGDELAIRSADDGSSEALDAVIQRGEEATPGNDPAATAS